MHPSQITSWKRTLLEHVPELFERGNCKAVPSEADLAALHANIGRLAMENDFLSKALETMR